MLHYFVFLGVIGSSLFRCHRIGQTKPVMVYRLVTRGTFDEKIVLRAAAKRKIEKLVIHKEFISFMLSSKAKLLCSSS